TNRLQNRADRSHSWLRKVGYFRVQAIHAFRTEAVSEVRFGMFADVTLQLAPGSLRVADLLAIGADRQQSLQRFHLRQRALEFPDQRFAFALRVLPISNIGEVDRQAPGPRWVDV